MSKAIRIEIEDGWYHAISHGIERRDIFGDDSDRRDFLERLFGLTESHAVVVHGYRLMKNHFRLQLQTRKANLKEAMQRLLSGYGVRFKLRHRRAGPLFRGRYRAILAGEGDRITETNRATGFGQIAALIAGEFERPWEYLKSRRGHPARSRAIVLSWRHTAVTLREIGERCGGSDYAAVAQAQRRMKTKLRNNARLATVVERIGKQPIMSYVET